MRGRTFTWVLALAAAVLALPAAAMTVPSGATLVVDDDAAQCPGAGFTSIQAAVDAAAPGDTVDVCAGSYGGVNVMKPVTLRGPRAASSRAASCVSGVVGVTTDAIVSGATITLAASGAQLRGFVIENAATGVVTDSAGSGYTVANNLFQHSTDGMRLASSGVTPSVASGNCFRHHARAAIWSIAVPVKNVDIEDNAFVDNGNNGGDGWAMALGEFRFGDGLVWVEDVTIARNTSTGDNRFVEIPGSRDVVIEANRSEGTSTSVFLANNNVRTRVSGNTFTDGQTGIYVSSIGPFGGLPNSGIEIAGNTVRGMSGVGIATEAGPSMLTSRVSGNVSTGNDYGISIADGSTGNTIDGNRATGNATFDCRDLTSGSGTSGTANTWSGNNRGTQNRPGLCPNRAPTASFTASPGSGHTGTPFTFDGSASSDPDGDALTFAWSFGDGASAGGSTATHAYAAAGTYTVALTVTDGFGGAATASRALTVSSAAAASEPRPEPAKPAPAPAPAEPKSHAVRVETAGDGYVRSGDRAIVCGRTCTASVPEGSVLVLEAIPAAGSTFAGWSGTACPPAAATCEIVVAGPMSVSAAFRKPRRSDPVILSATVSGPGAVASWEWGLDGAPIDCGTACAQRYARDRVVRVVAVPAPAQEFSRWGGACSGQGSWCTVRMSSSRQVHAVFTQTRRSN